MSGIPTIVEQLQQQQEQLNDQKRKVSEHLAKIESELARVLEALTALNGSAKNKTKKTKPSVKKDNVRETLRACLQERQFNDRSELQDEIGKRVTAEGFSRSGLALRIGEVLAEEEFSQAINTTT